MTGANTFVYIAGPYRADSYTAIEANINEAREWAAKLAQSGIPFVCPHLNSAHFEAITPDVPPEFWLAMYLRILESASAMLLLPSWGESVGTQTERDWMKAMGRPIYVANAFGLGMLVNDWERNAASPP